MDRQLKERLVGAVVLVALAVILIPEMLSGPAPTAGDNTGSVFPTTETTSGVTIDSPSEPTGTVKKYTIDLQQREPQTGALPGAVAEELLGSEITRTDAPPPEVEPTPSPSADKSPTPPEAKSTAPTDLPVPKPPEQKALPAKQVDVPAPPKQPPSNDVASTAKGKWAVQVASLGTRPAADRLAAELKSDGYAAFVMPFQVGGKTMFRVRIGPVADRAAAETLLAKVKRKQAGATIVSHS